MLSQKSGEEERHRGVIRNDQSRDIEHKCERVQFCEVKSTVVVVKYYRREAEGGGGDSQGVRMIHGGPFFKGSGFFS